MSQNNNAPSFSLEKLAIIEYFSKPISKYLKERSNTKARESFDQALSSAKEQLWKLKKLRGADYHQPIVQLLNEITEKIEEARTAASTANEASEFQSAEQTLALIKPKAIQVESLSKGLEKAFREELEAMPRYLQMLEAAKATREQIAALPGAKTQLADVEILLANGRNAVKNDGKVTTGYAAGFAILTKHSGVLVEAKEAAATFLRQSLPEAVKELHDQITDKLKGHRLVAPQFQSQLHEQAAARALELSRDEVPPALQQLGSILEAVTSETQTLREQSKSAANLRIEFGLELEKIQKSEVEGVLFKQLMDVKARCSEFIDNRDYVDAIELLKNGIKTAKSVNATIESDKLEWSSTAEELRKLQKRAEELKQWPPVNVAAQSLFDSVTIVLDAVATNHDYEAGKAEAQKIHDRLRSIEEQVAQGVGGELLDDVAPLLQKSSKEVETANSDLFENALAPLAEKLQKKGVTDTSATGFRAKRQEAIDAWTNYADNPAAESGASLADSIKNRKQTALDALASIKQDALKLLNSDQLLAPVVENAKRQQEQKTRDARPAKIARMLEFLQRMGVDTNADQLAFDEILDPIKSAQVPESRIERLEKFEKTIALKIKTAREKQKATWNAISKNVGLVDEALDKLIKKQPKFKSLFAEFKTRAADLKALVQAGDPELLEEVRAEYNRLRDEMITIDKYHGDYAPSTTLEAVEKEVDKLSGRLGEKNRVMERMPDSYKMLKANLDRAIAQAQGELPAKGLELLQPLGVEIENAALKAEQLETRYQQFKAQKKTVEGEWSDLRKLTKTWLTDRVKAYEEKIKTLLADAETTAGLEGELENAFQKLDAITSELNRIKTSSEPRVALQEEDAKAAQEQLRVRDMAMQFQKALETYEKQTLPTVRKKLQSVRGADFDQLDSLEKVGKRARTPVEPYLKMLSSSPLKQWTAETAPLLPKAIGEFAAARQMLDDATRTANRLAGNPQGTNVDVSGDLKKVNDNWGRRAQEFAAALGELASAIDTAAADHEEGEAKTNAIAIAKRVAKVKDHFAPAAFATSIQQLTNTEANDKDKLAAREEALRVVRQYTNDILKDPLFVKLNDPKNPFKNINTITSMVRVALKKLELEVLVGI